MNDQSGATGPAGTRITLADESRKARLLVDEAARAQQLAEEVAARNGVLLRTIADPAEYIQAVAALQQIWDHPDGAPLPAAILRAFAFTDNYVGATFDGDRIVGAAVGFRTGRGSLHSHIAGVLPSHRGRAIGYVLKLHERAWALRRGIESIAWTFDPLVRRNAHFNLVKLGATAAGYLPDFYGEMTDHINVGDHSDRLLVEWDLRRAVPGIPVPVGDDAVTVLRRSATGEPIVSIARHDVLRLEVPPDIEQLRGTDRALALRWRAAFREVIADAIANGHQIVGLASDSSYISRRTQEDLS